MYGVNARGHLPTCLQHQKQLNRQTAAFWSPEGCSRQCPTGTKSPQSPALSFCCSQCWLPTAPCRSSTPSPGHSSLLVKTMLGLLGLRMEESAALRQLRLGFVSGDNVPNKLYCYCPTVTAKLPFFWEFVIAESVSWEVLCLWRLTYLLINLKCLGLCGGRCLLIVANREHIHKSFPLCSLVKIIAALNIHNEPRQWHS